MKLIKIIVMIPYWIIYWIMTIVNFIISIILMFWIRLGNMMKLKSDLLHLFDDANAIREFGIMITEVDYDEHSED